MGDVHSALKGRAALLLWLPALAALSLFVAGIPIATDMSAFLPRSATPAQQALIHQLREGVASRMLLIGIEGAPEQELARASRALIRQLRQDPRFEYANNGESAWLREEREFLIDNRYLLSPAVTAERFSVASLRAALERDLELMVSPMGTLVKSVLPRDPTGELLEILKSVGVQQGPVTREGVWFGAEGTRALLVAQTRASGVDVDGQEAAIAAIERAFEGVKEGEGRQMRMLLSGPGVFAVASRTHIKGDAWRLSLLAIALVSGVLLFAFRSLGALLLALLPVATGALAGVAAVGGAFGTVHGITLGFGTTLIGEGVDYTIYLLTRVAPERPMRQALVRIWPLLRLGVLTSVCGFAAMLFSGFSGLAQLGMFSIVGLVTAVIVTRWVLPALPASSAPAASLLRHDLVRVQGRIAALRPLLMGVVIAAGAYLALHTGPFWDDDLANLSPAPRKLVEVDDTLRKDLGTPDVRRVVVVTAADREGALRASEALIPLFDDLQRTQAIAGFDLAARYLPSEQAQHRRLDALPSGEDLRHSLGRALEGLPFKAGAFEPFVADVEAARSGGPLSRSALGGTAIGLKVDSLLFELEGRWVALVTLTGMTNESAVERAVAAAGVGQASILDLKAEMQRMVSGYRDEALQVSLWGATALILLLLAGLRSVANTLRVLVPLAAAIIVVLAVLLASGVRLNLFHLVALLLVLGVGSNYTLFFIAMRGDGEDRSRTLLALVLCNLSTVCGFGVLALSSAPVLKAIGTTVALGALLSLVFGAAIASRAKDG